MSTQHYFDQSLLPHSSLRFRMVRVHAGAFLMGSPEDGPDAENDEKPQHRVQLDAFLMAEHAVTQDLWKAVMGTDPSHFKGGMRPVEQVSWFDAAVFCNALSKMTNRSPVYLDPQGQPYGWDGKQWTLPNEGEVQVSLPPNGGEGRGGAGYCLPKEAQWEYAARAGQDESLKYAGSDLLDQVGWYADNSGGETREAGLLMPNALGLYDMIGNVFEWCEDWWADYRAEPQENSPGPEKGVTRVMRGGRWGGSPQRCRLAYRSNAGPGTRDDSIGFRLALQVDG